MKKINNFWIIVCILMPLIFMGCREEKITVKNLDQVPLCSTGKKAELDVEYIKIHHPEDYAKLPWAVRKLGFRPMICKPD